MKLQQTTTRPQAVTALREIARALSAAWDLDTTLDLIARKTTEVMRVDSCSIYLLDPDGVTLRLRATTGLARDVLGRATLQIGEGMTGHAVAQNRPVHASDAPQNPHFKWVSGTSESAFRSLLAVPLSSEAEAIGAMNVQTADPHAYTAQEVEVLSLIADLAAGALVKARLHDEQKRQLAELHALAEVSEVVTSPQYLDDILDMVTEMAARLLQATACTLYLLDESGTRLELRSIKYADGRQNDHDGHPPTRLPAGQGVIGRVASSGRPAYVQNVQTAGDYCDRAGAQQQGLVSLLAGPLSVREQVKGVFICYTGSQHNFSQEEEALLLTLCNQMALAIEHARLATTAAMTREIHHRIKNNLQTVAMLIQLQLGEVTDANTRQVLLSSMHRVYSIAAVHEVLSERGFHLVNVKDVLHRLAMMNVNSLSLSGQAVRVRVEGEAVMLPSRAATNVALVVNELVQNALEHAFPAQSQGEVQITLAHVPTGVVITVRDNGQGLPDAYRPGLGTEIVRTLVREELRGRLSYHSPGKGTEVILHLPAEAERGS